MFDTYLKIQEIPIIPTKKIQFITLQTHLEQNIWPLMIMNDNIQHILSILPSHNTKCKTDIYDLHHWYLMIFTLLALSGEILKYFTQVNIW